MRDVLKRLERLESESAPPRIRHAIISLIEADNGKAVPFDPNVAECGGERLMRLPSEGVEAFEARAADHFTGWRIMLFRDPSVTGRRDYA